MSTDTSIEELTLQLSKLKLTNDEEDVDDLIDKISALHISDDSKIDKEMDDLIEQMSKMSISVEIKLIILHTINHCRLQYNSVKHYPKWQEAF